MGLALLLKYYLGPMLFFLLKCDWRLDTFLHHTNPDIPWYRAMIGIFSKDSSIDHDWVDQRHPPQHQYPCGSPLVHSSIPLPSEDSSRRLANFGKLLHKSNLSILRLSTVHIRVAISYQITGKVYYRTSPRRRLRYHF